MEPSPERGVHAQGIPHLTITVSSVRLNRWSWSHGDLLDENGGSMLDAVTPWRSRLTTI